MKVSLSLSALALVTILGVAGCNPPTDANGPRSPQKPGSTDTPKPTSSTAVSIDGSDTVEPITSAIAEELGAKSEIAVGKAGTGAGFQKFINGEIDIADASRPVNADEDAKLKEKGIEYYEVAISYDGVAIIANAKNKLDTITKDQLHKMWDKDSKVANWNEVDPSWPASKLTLYGPTSAHGTYDFFNEAINGDKKNCRQDYSQQATYDPLVTGVAGDAGALGYVGYAYAASNTGVKILKLDTGKGAIAPSPATIADGTYPLSRPLFIYVSKKSYDSKQAVKDFVALALDATKVPAIVTDQKFVPLPTQEYDLGMKLITGGKTGSHFKAGTKYADDVNAALK